MSISPTSTWIAQKDQPDLAVPTAELKRVIVERRAVWGDGYFPGMVMAVFGAHFFFTDNMNPGILLSFAAVGALFGEGINLGFSSVASESVFDIEHGDSVQTLERFRALQRNELDGPRHHFALSDAMTFPHVLSAYQKILNPWGTAEVTNVQALRKLSFSYSLTSSLELGCALMFMGENNPFPYSYASGHLETNSRVQANGEYATVTYHPLRNAMPRWLQLSLNAGIGYTQDSLYLETYPDGKFHFFSWSKNYISLMAGVSAEAFTTNGFSIGVYADYAFLPTVTIPKEMGNNAVDQTFDLSNGAIGVLAGIHL